MSVQFINIKIKMGSKFPHDEKTLNLYCRVGYSDFKLLEKALNSDEYWYYIEEIKKY